MLTDRGQIDDVRDFSCRYQRAGDDDSAATVHVSVDGRPAPLVVPTTFGAWRRAIKAYAEDGGPLDLRTNGDGR